MKDGTCRGLDRANGGELGSEDHTTIDDVLNEFGVSLTYTPTCPANV